MAVFSKPVRGTPFHASYPFVCDAAGKFPARAVLQSCDTDVPLKDRTSALVRGLDLVLQHHGACELTRSELSKQLHSFLDSANGEKMWLKRAKHTLAYPLARYLRNEPPPSADQIFRPSGLLRRYMKNRMLTFNRKNSHLWYSWFQAKRSSLPASENIIEDTYTDHLKALTAPDDGDQNTIDKIFDVPTFSRLLNRLTIGVATSMAEEDFTCYAPTTSACFENKRSKGGQHEYLRTLSHIGEPGIELGFDELVSMNERPVPSRRVFDGEKRFHDTSVTECRMRVGRDDWKDLAGQSREIDNDVPLQCTIQAVLEPMKVRVISKGEALPYYSMKPLQVAMHSMLRKMDCFRLIGRPFCPTDMMDLKKKSSPTDEWFSIDYSAATDGLSYKYSGRILEELIRLLPPYQAERARRVLGMHDLYYPVKHEVYGYSGKVDTEYRGQMTRGQLMGSILSFPILCLANLGVYLLVTQDSQKGWTDEERLSHVLINGDDMLYSANPSLWPQHIEAGTKVGLNMSVGKAYHHPVYANVNSTSVHYDLRKTGTPFKVGFLNSGLFFGQHKVQGGKEVYDTPLEKASVTFDMQDDEEARPLKEILIDQIPLLRFCKDENGVKTLLEEFKDDSLVSSLNVLLEGSLPGRDVGLLKKFLSLHRKSILRQCMCVVKKRTKRGFVNRVHVRNLFIHPSLGGMGVIPPVGWKYDVTIADKLLAAWMIEEVDCNVDLQLPLKGRALKEESDDQSPWFKRVIEDDTFVTMGLGKSFARSRLRVHKVWHRLRLHPVGCSILAIRTLSEPDYSLNPINRLKKGLLETFRL